MTRCFFCKAELVFARTMSGKWLALNAEEVREGLRYRITRQPDGVPLATREDYGPGRVEHKPLCPRHEEHGEQGEMKW